MNEIVMRPMRRLKNLVAQVASQIQNKLFLEMRRRRGRGKHLKGRILRRSKTFLPICRSLIITPKRMKGSYKRSHVA